MADTAKVVERIADRFLKTFTDAFESALSRGSNRISESQLANAITSGNERSAVNQALRALDVEDLHVLVQKQPLSEHLLDVAEESANATRCAVRPTGPGRSVTASVDAASHAVQEAGVAAARAMVGTDTITVTADMQRAINSTPLRIPRDLPSPAEIQQALSEAASVARFDSSSAKAKMLDIAGLRPTKRMLGDSELVVRYRQGLPVPPVVVNQQGVILDGHERVASAWAAGLDRIQSVVVNSEQEAALIEWLRWNN